MVGSHCVPYFKILNYRTNNIIECIGLYYFIWSMDFITMLLFIL